MRSLIDILQADQADESGWKPSEPQPIPDGINELALDTETDGLDWAGKSRIIGLSYSCLLYTSPSPRD